MMLKAFKYAFEENLEVVLRVFLLAIKEAEKEESLDTLIYYGEIYLKYIELTNSQLKEEDIREEIRKLDGKGDVTMGILEQIEERGIKKGIQKGIQKGIKEGKIKTAKNSLKLGIPLEQVAQISELTLEEVKKIKRELEK
ncbi:conserved hypothetical protein (putative transposase or invertase) [Desulfonispora thiosulfatigenes DSM 11270]|uniref:Transposase (putative) YhgA-like domain-containing protein n=2 Tax=Desulfonispora thiosulfatigenes TaxID=83661 RepID=A0A1W1VTP5_DESTI|nr:hypothetical protein [Desulfonispora thiosulfatigenes]SMB96729.1 conserved hypothetical protein (putative transposase or invertase) [Desulfonispora thiosulfatigenes DSM 11270]